MDEDEVSLPQSTADLEFCAGSALSSISDTIREKEEPWCVLCLSNVGMILQDGGNELRWLPCRCCCCCLNCFKNEAKDCSIKCSNTRASHKISGYEDLDEVELPSEGDKAEITEHVRLVSGTKPKLMVDIDGEDSVAEAAADDSHEPITEYEMSDPYCDNCLAKNNKKIRANHYCTELGCRKWYCGRHKMCHNEDAVPEHRYIDKEEYKKSPHLHGNPSVCLIPGHNGIIACAICFKYSCSTCNFPEPCKESSKHEWRQLGDIEEILDQRLKELVRKTESKIENYQQNISTSEGKFKAKNNDIDKMKAGVKQQLDMQIKAIKKDAKKINNELMDQHEKETNDLHSHTGLMKSKISSLEEAKCSVILLNQQCTLEKLKNLEAKSREVERAFEEATLDVVWTAPLALTKHGPHKKLEFHTARVPSCLEYSKSLKDWQGTCFAVGFHNDGKLWLGHQKGLATSKSVNDLEDPSQFQIIKKVKSCVSVAPYNAVVYYTEEVSNPDPVEHQKGKVRAFMLINQEPGAFMPINQEPRTSIPINQEPINQEPIDIFDYDLARDAPATLAVSENFLALTNNNDDGVVLYNLKTKKKNSYKFSDWHSGVQFHPDGCLLVTDEKSGTVSKHAIDLDLTEEPKLKWRLDGGLEEPDAITVDTNGLIYVKSCNKKAIYVISEGKDFEKLDDEQIPADCGKISAILEHDHIPTGHGQMSIYDDNLVLACCQEKEFKSFKLCRQ